MKCEEVRQHWHLFHDSEGDAELHLQINAHLEMCPECARRFFEQSRLEEGITQRLKGDLTPSAALWEGIQRQLAPAEPAKARNWFLFSSAVIVLAAGVLLAVLFGPWGRRSGTGAPDLAQLSVALHEELLSGREAVKFASESPIEVENYLRRQVSFPVRCPPREDAGFEVRGGGTCRLANDAVAYVVGRVDGNDVSLFILSRESLPHFPHQFAAVRREGIHRCREGDNEMVMTEFDENVVLVVGRTAPEVLARVLKAYGTYPHVPAT